MQMPGRPQCYKSSRRSLRGMLTMGLCYCLILGAIGLVIVWSPLSRPDAANSQAPLLMQLEQVKPQVHLDMAKHVTPNPLVHVHVATPKCTC